MLHVVWNEAECERTWREGRDCFAPRLFEMLDDLGLSYASWDPGAWIARKPSGITIAIGGMEGGGAAWEHACADYCAAGGGLLAIGDTHGLDRLLGVACEGVANEGWVDWGGAELAAGLLGSFHFFGATQAAAAAGTEAWGQLTARSGAGGGTPAVTFRSVGAGAAAFIAVDLMKTACTIQMGQAVVRDGFPAPDGSAPIDDGLLKTDDGAVLDWERDRDTLDAGGAPFFLHPIVDEWRILFMRVFHRLAERLGGDYAHVWFWPEGAAAIGHISHDTDGHSGPCAERLLGRLREAGIRSTWCTLMPGYERELRERIAAEGHEIAFHYNAMGTDVPESRWSEAHFRSQLAMLAGQYPGYALLSNKNHYLRWEGGVAFYEWCERAGIVVEMSKGGTKRGNKGFLFGTCHPHAPVHTAKERNRPMKLISLPTLAWDPPMPSRCTLPEAFALMERARDVYGVAHLLFHPGWMTGEDEIGPGLVASVRHGDELGLRWWTAEEIWRWRETRRGLAVGIFRRGEQAAEVVVDALKPVKGATFLIARGVAGTAISAADGAAAVRSYRAAERFGCRYMELIADVPAGRSVFVLGASDEGAERSR